MKYTILLLSALFLSMLFSCSTGAGNSGQNADSTKTANEINPNLKLQVYYFHATNRCPTCNSIEANVKNVLESNFKDQLAQGIVNFKVICVDDVAYKELVNKYEAAGAALHLVKIEYGKETDNDLTELAFLHSRNAPAIFLKEMQDTISYFIK